MSSVLEEVDVEKTTDEQIDVADYSTARGAAKAVARRVRGLAEELGHDPDVEVTLQKRDGRLGDRFVLFYEGGPNNWAYNLPGGEPAFVGTDPEVVGFREATDVLVESEYSFALAFYER